MTNTPVGRLLDQHDALLLDLDGTLFRGGRPVPGAREAVALADASGHRIGYLTNNASRTPGQVADHLQQLGFTATPEQVLTSAQAAATLLAQRLPAGAPVLVLGTAGLADEIRRAGLAVTDRAEAAAGVVQGYSPELCSRDLAEGCLAIRAGATWVSSNMDPTLPTERGQVPGNGAMVAALQAATGATPEVAGKPQPMLLEMAIRRTGARRPLMVGDRLDSDIEGARAAGVASLLVLTGVTGPRSVLAAPPARRPDYLAADLGALTADSGGLRAVVQPGWTVTRHGGALRLHSTGAGDPVGALRALCAERWAEPWSGQASPVIEAADPAAAAALHDLGLGGDRAAEATVLSNAHPE